MLRCASPPMPVIPETPGGRLGAAAATSVGTVNGPGLDEAGWFVPALVHQGHEPWSSRLKPEARQPDQNRLRYHAANLAVRQHLPS